MTAVARLLRTLRWSAGLSIDDAAVAMEATPGRIRALERGEATLEYLDGLALAKAYLLCPTCFAKHFRAAMARSDHGVPQPPAASFEGDSDP
ncbi:MAG TPA: helix-turn-helix transcriptional regulator [Candidatus Limnocylindrales bacterium]|nr:helix-turn-helix transcriptional regulator [Candidatus Limnocylindrales bacterium]